MRNLKSLPDPDLVVAAQQGDHDAFEELVYRYDTHVLSIAARYVNQADDAKDIYQEVFLRVYKASGNSGDRANSRHGSTASPRTSVFPTALDDRATRIGDDTTSMSRELRNPASNGSPPARTHRQSEAPSVWRSQTAYGIRWTLSRPSRDLCSR